MRWSALLSRARLRRCRSWGPEWALEQFVEAPNTQRNSRLTAPFPPIFHFTGIGWSRTATWTLPSTWSRNVLPAGFGRRWTRPSTGSPPTDESEAVRALADRHGRSSDEVLPTNG